MTVESSAGGADGVFVDPSFNQLAKAACGAGKARTERANAQPFRVTILSMSSGHADGHQQEKQTKLCKESPSLNDVPPKLASFSYGFAL